MSSQWNRAEVNAITDAEGGVAFVPIGAQRLPIGAITLPLRAFFLRQRLLQ